VNRTEAVTEIHLHFHSSQLRLGSWSHATAGVGRAAGQPAPHVSTEIYLCNVCSCPENMRRFRAAVLTEICLCNACACHRRSGTRCRPACATRGSCTTTRAWAGARPWWAGARVHRCGGDRRVRPDIRAILTEVCLCNVCSCQAEYWYTAVLTEIYLCNGFSGQEITGNNGRSKRSTRCWSSTTATRWTATRHRRVRRPLRPFGRPC
jgi:hypothetical protein